MSFAAPQFLLALVAVPLLAVAYLAIERSRARRSASWSRDAMQPNIVRRPPRRLGLLPAAAFLLGLTFLLVAFARPQQAASDNGGGAGPLLVLAFDVSGSMAARDVRPMRLRAARALAIRLLNKLPPKYEVAVVTFGGKVQITVPPTSDRKKVIAHLPQGITPLAGSSIGDGIAAAVALAIHDLPQGAPVDRLHPAGAVLLLSDGAQTGGGTMPDDAASTAFVYAIPINAVVVGTSAGSVTQPLTVSGFRTTTQIAVPVSPLTLQKISQLTGGVLLDGSSAAKLTAAADKLPAALEKEGLSAIPQSARGKQQLSAAAGGVGLVFILGGILLSGLLFGRLL